MNALHRCNDAEFCEAGDVVTMNMLGVLNPPAEVAARGVACESLLIDVEHFAVGPVADGVNAQLEVVIDRQAGRLRDAFDGGCVESAAAGEVGVGFQKPGTPRAEGSINRSLDRADGQVIVADADHFVPVEVGSECFVAVTDHHPESGSDRALFDQFFESIDCRQ